MPLLIRTNAPERLSDRSTTLMKVGILRKRSKNVRQIIQRINHFINIRILYRGNDVGRGHCN